MKENENLMKKITILASFLITLTAGITLLGNSKTITQANFVAEPEILTDNEQVTFSALAIANQVNHDSLYPQSYQGSGTLTSPFRINEQIVITGSGFGTFSDNQSNVVTFGSGNFTGCYFSATKWTNTEIHLAITQNYKDAFQIPGVHLDTLIVKKDGNEIASIPVYVDSVPYPGQPEAITCDITPPTATNTFTHSSTPSLTYTPSLTPVPPTNTATNSLTSTPSNTYTLTPTLPATNTATSTLTSSSTPTITETPSITFTPSETATSTETATSSTTVTASETLTPSNTSTESTTPSPSITFTNSQTTSPTDTPTITNTTTETNTVTTTKTPTLTTTNSSTPSHTQTSSATSTQTNTPTATLPIGDYSDELYLTSNVTALHQQANNANNQIWIGAPLNLVPNSITFENSLNIPHENDDGIVITSISGTQNALLSTPDIFTLAYGDVFSVGFKVNAATYPQAFDTTALLWIDWNKNGVPDAGDYIDINRLSGIQSPQIVPYFQNITVPTITTNNVLLRARIFRGSQPQIDQSNKFAWAYRTTTNGEVEDYLLRVSNATDTPTSTQTATYTPSLTTTTTATLTPSLTPTITSTPSITPTPTQTSTIVADWNDNFIDVLTYNYPGPAVHQEQTNKFLSTAKLCNLSNLTYRKQYLGPQVSYAENAPNSSGDEDDDGVLVNGTNPSTDIMTIKKGSTFTVDFLFTYHNLDLNLCPPGTPTPAPYAVPFHIGVWIDWDGNGVFDSITEEFRKTYEINEVLNHTPITFNIPYFVNPDTNKPLAMRVRAYPHCKYNDANRPCSLNENRYSLQDVKPVDDLLTSQGALDGEVEDYILYVDAPDNTATQTLTPSLTPTLTKTNTTTPTPTSTPKNPQMQCSSPNLLIPDPIQEVPQEVSNTITYTGNIIHLLSDLEVFVDISHSYVGELDIQLEHVETGTTIDLFTGSTCEESNIKATFDDAAITDVLSLCSNTDPQAISGFVDPVGDLSDFSGEQLEGTWKIKITDEVSGDMGVLNSWCILPHYFYQATTTPTGTATVTPTSTPTNTVIPSSTGTETATATITNTATQTLTPSPVPSSICVNLNALSIPDNSVTGISSIITFPTTTSKTTIEVQDLSVYLDITHTFVGDLQASIKHLSTGTTVQLLDKPGDPPSFGCQYNNVKATFTDFGSFFAENTCINAVGTPAISGNVKPNQVLSSFNGELLEDSWQLTVSDLNYLDVGTINSWCIAYQPIEVTITPSATPSSTNTQTSTSTATSTASQTETQSPTITATPTTTSTNTTTPTSTNTFTPSETSTSTNTATNTTTPTHTFTPSITATETSTSTNTSTNTSTPTQTNTYTPSITNTPTETATNTATYSPTNTSTNTYTPSETSTPSITATPSNTNTNTNTTTSTTIPTYTNTNTPTFTSTNTPTVTATFSIIPDIYDRAYTLDAPYYPYTADPNPGFNDDDDPYQLLGVFTTETPVSHQIFVNTAPQVHNFHSQTDSDWVELFVPATSPSTTVYYYIETLNLCAGILPADTNLDLYDNPTNPMLSGVSISSGIDTTRSGDNPLAANFRSSQIIFEPKAAGYLTDTVFYIHVTPLSPYFNTGNNSCYSLQVRTSNQAPTATATNTPTITNTSTRTFTYTQTATRTQTPTFTQTFTRTPSYTRTQSPTVTETFTRTATRTPSETFTSTPTRTPSNTRTFTPSLTPSNTRTPSLTITTSL